MSTRSLGQLTLDLVTRTGGFTGPLDKAARHTKKTMKDISSSVKAVTATVAASTAAVAAAGAGIYAYTKAGMDSIDTQVKLARQVDATIGELRGVTRAAEDAGIAQGRLEGSLLSYNKRLGDTIRGTGEAKKAYEALGIEASELAEMPLADQLALISDRISQLDSTAARTSIADKLMSGGRETVKLFESGGDAIRDAVQEIEDYGLAIDMIDASVIEAANDALDRTTLVADSARDALAVELAPVILEVTDRFNEAAREAGGLGEYVGSAVDTSIESLGTLLDSYQELVVFNQRVVVGTNDMDLAFAKFSKNAWEWLGDLHDLSYKWVNLLIRGMNYVSDADIPEIKYEGSDLEERHNRRVQEARGERNLSQMELNKLLEQSSPSKYLDELLDDAERRRDEIAANAYKDQFKPLDQWFLRESDIPSLGDGDDDDDASSSSAVDSIQRQVDALRLQAETLGMTADEQELYQLAAKGATDAQLAQARAAQQTISDYEDQQQALNDYRQMVESLRTPEERLNDTLNERLDILDAVDVSQQEHAEQLERIAEAGFSDAPEFGGLDASIGGAFGELAKVDEAESELQEWYETQLSMLAEYREQRADLEQTWNEQEQQLKEEHEARLAEIEKSRQTAQLAAAEGMFGDLADITKTFAGEQSGIYKAMFAAEKAFAIASSIVSIQQGIAEAAKLPFPANIPAMATVASATAGIVSTIQGTELAGMAHDGIDRVPQEGTWLLDRGERVLTAEQADRSDKVDRAIASIAEGQRSAGQGALPGEGELPPIYVDARQSSDPVAMEQAARRGAEEGYRKVFEDVATNGAIRRALGA